MLKTIQNAILNNERLDMIYMDHRGEVSKRRVQPYLLKESTFFAYCYLRNSRRTFKTDQVLALVPVMKRERMVV